ncbi:MAG: hypothetical protein CV088_14245 [Nitrospira sp. LK70]|nr:hypothetical protein [Nitrospira sp. LK70]
MRTPNQITVDRALLLYVLQLAEPYDGMSDVKLQQLCFLCELQTFAKGLKAFHFEFFRFAYGAFLSVGKGGSKISRSRIR